MSKVTAHGQSEELVGLFETTLHCISELFFTNNVMRLRAVNSDRKRHKRHHLLVFLFCWLGLHWKMRDTHDPSLQPTTTTVSKLKLVISWDIMAVRRSECRINECLIPTLTNQNPAKPWETT